VKHLTSHERPNSQFYDPLAEHYHLLFDDWDKAIDRQSRILGPLLAARGSSRALKILDCACGIGTQSLALAKLGRRVCGPDLSVAAVTRAREEARKRSLEIGFRVCDMTALAEGGDHDFDAVVARQRTSSPAFGSAREGG
jgi:glycine/sarcosine N-methyltransferase